MLAADIKRAVGSNVDVILFNIDSKASNADGRYVILRVFLKVFNERLGYCGDHAVRSVQRSDGFPRILRKKA